MRPERVFVWHDGDPTTEPTLYDAHVEEVRSGHNEEPEDAHIEPEGGMDVWDPRLDRLGGETRPRSSRSSAPTASRSPSASRSAPTRPGSVVHIDADPLGRAARARPACLCAHAHAEDLTWQRSYQVRGDLTEQDGRLVLHPHRVVAGLQLPSSSFERYRVNVRKILRFRKTARDRERARADAGAGA